MWRAKGEDRDNVNPARSQSTIEYGAMHRTEGSHPSNTMTT